MSEIKYKNQWFCLKCRIIFKYRFQTGSGFDPSMDSAAGGNGLPLFPSSSDGADDYHSRSPASSFSVDEKSSEPSTPRDYSVSPKTEDLDMSEMDSSALNWVELQLIFYY